MYEIVFSKQAVRKLRSLPDNVATTIRAKLEIFRLDPNAPNNNVTELVGRPGYRLRVDDWRVIYELQDEKLILLIIKVGSRGEVYE